MAIRPKKSALSFRRSTMTDPLAASSRPRFSVAGDPWIPAADVADCGTLVVIRMEIPGIDPEELLVLQDGRTLLIQGQRLRQEQDTEACFHLMEIQYGPFERTFDLPEYLDLDGIAADYRDGFLTIRIRKAVGPPREARVLKVRIQETT